MILSFINQKGGVGKTTISLLMALAISQAGRKVSICDLDEQGTSTNIVTSWQKNGIADIGLVSSPKAKEGGIVIIDTPPKLNDVTKRAVQAATCCILISSPSPLDLISSQKTIHFMRKHAGGRLNMSILFNGIVSNTRLARDLGDVAAQLGIHAMKNSLLRSINYQHMGFDGWNALNAEQVRNASTIAIEILTMSQNHDQ